MFFGNISSLLLILLVTLFKISIYSDGYLTMCFYIFPAKKEIHESTFFMDSLETSSRTYSSVKKKRRLSGATPVPASGTTKAPSTPTTPPSPVSPTTAIAQSLPSVPSVSINTSQAVGPICHHSHFNTKLLFRSSEFGCI